MPSVTDGTDTHYGNGGQKHLHSIDNLRQWIQRDFRKSNWTSHVDVVEDSGGNTGAGPRYRYHAYLYTDINRYSITAEVNPNKTYMGCIAQTRKPRAGEDWPRGNDLADGPLSPETWHHILADIVCYEIVKVHTDHKKYGRGVPDVQPVMSYSRDMPPSLFGSHHENQVAIHLDRLVRNYANRPFRTDTSNEIANVTNDAINLARSLNASHKDKQPSPLHCSQHASFEPDCIDCSDALGDLPSQKIVKVVKEKSAVGLGPFAPNCDGSCRGGDGPCGCGQKNAKRGGVDNGKQTTLELTPAFIPATEVTPTYNKLWSKAKNKPLEFSVSELWEALSAAEKELHTLRRT